MSIRPNPRRNLQEVRTAVSLGRRKGAGAPPTGLRRYQLLADPEGGLHSQKPLDSALQLSGKPASPQEELSPIDLVVSESPSLHFEVLGAEKLPRGARKVVEATLQVLNEGASHFKQGKNPSKLPEEAVLEELILPRKVGEELIVREMTREEAEKALESSPKGSYLLRSLDPSAEQVVSQLREVYQIADALIFCYSEGNGKLSERLILQIELPQKQARLWTYYDDSPELAQPWFLSLETLIYRLSY